MKKDLRIGDEVVAICMGSVLKRFVVDSISRMGDVRYKDSEGNPSTLLTNHWTKENGQIGVIYPHKSISHINCVEYYYVTDEKLQSVTHMCISVYSICLFSLNCIKLVVEMKARQQSTSLKYKQINWKPKPTYLSQSYIISRPTFSRYTTTF